MSIFNKESRITDLLKELGAENIAHVKNGSLYAHLLRVGRTLESFGLEGSVVHAGMCHSVYGTDFFPEKLLSLDERARLRSVTGEEAERLVFLFGTIKRGTLYKKDAVAK